MNSTNAHNLLPSSDILSAADYTASFITAENVVVEVYQHVANAHTHNAIRYAAALILAVEAAGLMSASDATEMLDYTCAMMVAA
jgi:hypothetical protein